MKMQNEEHCLHSEKRYGVRGDDIHTWIDEPSQIAGGSHRDYRHDLENLPLAIKMFEGKYGADMVENIFLDHLKADSEDRRNKQNFTNNPNSLWNEEEDNYLIINYHLSTEELETVFQGKRGRKEILSRKKFLGIIVPRIFKYKQTRLLKLLFKLEREQKLFITIRILSGGNRDINFCVGKSKKVGNSIETEGDFERFAVEKSFVYTPEYSGQHTFNFSNLFSIFTSKEVEVSYHLENGKEITLEVFQI